MVELAETGKQRVLGRPRPGKEERRTLMVPLVSDEVDAIIANPLR